MLSMFRRFASSPVGLGVFALILIAFVVTLYEGKTGLPGVTGSSVAKVGGEDINETELTRRVQNQLDGARGENPALNMASFVAQGGVEQTLTMTMNRRAIEVFAQRQGMVANRTVVDGEIASIPAFNGPTGSFDHATFLAAIAQRKVSEAQVRDDFRGAALTKALLIPITAATKAPSQLVLPYASLLLEGRTGEIAELPSGAFAPRSIPSDVELQQFYKQNAVRYTIAERRVIRYASFSEATLGDAVKPTNRQVESYYQANPGRYAAREQRAFTQVILPSKAQADEVLKKVKGGMTFAAAAKSVQRDPLPVALIDKEGFTKLTSAPVANAAFTAPKGQFAAVARSGLGFHVVKVDAVDAIAATPLTSVRNALVTELTAENSKRILTDLVAKIDEEASGNATLDEIAKKHGLTIVTSPAVTSGGQAFDVANYQRPPELGPILSEAFQADPDDDPSVAQIDAGKSFAVWKLDRVVPPAPQPIAKVREQLIVDVNLAKGSRAAKQAADRVMADVNAGTPLAQAMAKLGVKLPTVEPIKATRIQLAQSGQRIPPPVALMFSMTQKRAKQQPIPGQQGWYVVHLVSIQRGDASSQPGLVQNTQQQFGRMLGDEYAQQFATAILAEVGSSKDAAAVARLKQGLTSGANQ